MKATFKNAWGYQGNAMDLPVENLDAAVPFYERVMGFRSESENETSPRATVLVRDGIRMRLAENGGDPSQDGCAFDVDDVKAAHAEIKEGLEEFNASPAGRAGSVSPELKIETQGDGSSWKVFYIIAPDGLCYWVGEKQ